MDILVYCIKKSFRFEWTWSMSTWFVSCTLSGSESLSPGPGQYRGKLGWSLPQFTNLDCQKTRGAWVELRFRHFFQNPPNKLGLWLLLSTCGLWQIWKWFICDNSYVSGSWKQKTLLLDLTPHGFSKADFEYVISSHNPVFNAYRSIRTHTEILVSTSEIKICPSNC